MLLYLQSIFLFNECIRDGILADFLTQNKSEVIAMSIFEYDEKAVRQVYYEYAENAKVFSGRNL